MNATVITAMVVAALALGLATIVCRRAYRTVNRWRRKVSKALIQQSLIYDALVGEKADDPSFVFGAIYRQGVWGKGSGPGSDPGLLKGYMKFLESFIREHQVSSVCDVGCGDWQYMRRVDLGGAKYVGYDVAREVIEADAKLFSAPNVSFRHYGGDFADLEGADLCICKDVFQHLPNAKVWEFIAQLGKFRYALVANGVDAEAAENADIKMGDWRPLDLRLPPFNLRAEKVFSITTRDFPRRGEIAVLLLKNGGGHAEGD